jgi:hypothetical protein
MCWEGDGNIDRFILMVIGIWVGFGFVFMRVLDILLGLIDSICCFLWLWLCDFACIGYL